MRLHFSINSRGIIIFISLYTETELQKDDHHDEVGKKLIQLPLNRIKGIMKLDPDVNVTSAAVIFAIAKSVELFIQSLARESFVHTAHSKKKTMQKADVDLAIASVDSLTFLDGALTF